jgi:type II secretory pathway pseudopilin PulG
MRTSKSFTLKRSMAHASGFTLIELMAASVLALMIIGTLSYCLMTYMRQIEPIMEQTRIRQVERMLAVRISNDIAQSSGILAGSTSSTLKLANVTYSMVDGKIKRSSGADNVFLTVAGETDVSFSYSTQKLVRVNLGRAYSFYVFARN